MRLTDHVPPIAVKDIMNGHNPNIFKIFIQTGQSASTDTNETQRHRAGETSQNKRQKKKKLKKESHWDKVSKQYKEGEITKFEYVKQMSYKLF